MSEGAERRSDIVVVAAPVSGASRRRPRQEVRLRRLPISAICALQPASQPASPNAALHSHPFLHSSSQLRFSLQTFTKRLQQPFKQAADTIWFWLRFVPLHLFPVPLVCFLLPRYLSTLSSLSFSSFTSLPPPFLLDPNNIFPLLFLFFWMFNPPPLKTGWCY